jgi:hypothetical protein
MNVLLGCGMQGITFQHIERDVLELAIAGIGGSAGINGLTLATGVLWPHLVAVGLRQATEPAGLNA